MSKYEEGKSEPPIPTLTCLARYYHVIMDIMTDVGLHTVNMDNLMELGDNRILLPVLVDRECNDNIEVVPIKARAGYLQGNGDPEFIQILNFISPAELPVGKYRAFPIVGDSIPLHQLGSFIVSRYIESLNDIKDGKTYVILSRNDGIVHKRVFRKRNRFINYALIIRYTLLSSFTAKTFWKCGNTFVASLCGSLSWTTSPA